MAEDVGVREKPDDGAGPAVQAHVEALRVPLVVPEGEWVAVDSVERYVALGMVLPGYYCPQGWLYVWDATTGAVVCERDGLSWECREDEVITMVKLSPQGKVAGLATSSGRIVVHSALRSPEDRRLDGLTLQHTKHAARVTGLCWGYKGLYSCDEAGQIYQFDWMASFAPTLLADVQEPVLQINSRAFTGEYESECVLLVVVTVRRCLLIDTETGMVATVAGNAGSLEGPVGACFTWRTGELVVAFPTSVWVIAVSSLDQGVEVKSKHEVSHSMRLLSPLRDGRVAGVSTSGDAVQIMTSHGGCVETVATAPIVDAVFTLRGDAVLLQEGLRLDWLSVGGRGLSSPRQRYTNSHFTGRVERRSILTKVAATAAAAAALSLVGSAVACLPRRRYAPAEPTRRQAQPEPPSFLVMEDLERARKLSRNVLSTATSVWSSVLSMAEGPVPYRGVLFAVAGMAAVAVSVPPQRRRARRQSSRPRVIKEGRRNKEATITDKVKKARAPRQAATITPEELVRVHDEASALYASRMRGLVDESQQRLQREYEMRVAAIKVEATHAAASSAALVAVLSVWSDHPLQARHDELTAVISAAALAVGVCGWHEMNDRFRKREAHRMCRELTELVMWNVDAGIDDLEKQAKKERQRRDKEAEEAARVALQSKPRASQVSIFRTQEGQEADELFAALEAISRAKQHAKDTACAAVLGVLIHAGVTTQIQRTESISSALTKWATELLSQTEFLSVPKSPSSELKQPPSRDSARFAVPEEVRSQLPPQMVSEFEAELQQVCAPIAERHRDELLRFSAQSPHEGTRVVYQHQGTPLWRTEWGTDLLQITDPPAWAELTERRKLRKLTFNPVDDPDLLPNVSWVWTSDWRQTSWEYSTTGEVWDSECGMFCVLRRRQWTRSWYCHRNHQEYNTLVETQSSELQQFTVSVVRDLIDRSQQPVSL